MLDPKTLSITIILGNLAFATLASLYIATIRERSPAIEMWRWAKLITALGFLYNAIRQDYASLPAVIGNQAQIIGFTLELLAFLHLLGRTNLTKWVITGAVACVACFPFVLLAAPGENSRIVYNSLSIGVILLTMAAVLLSSRGMTRIPLLVGGIDLIGAMLLLGRAFIGLSQIPFTPYDTRAINLAIYILAYLALIINGFGFLLLAKWKSDNKLHAVLAELKNKDSEQRQFISMLSHEIRTPLAVIDATTQSLSFRVQDQPELLSVVARIRRGSRQLLTLFDNSLSIERMQSAQYHPEFALLSVASLAQWAEETWELYSGQHSLRVECEAGLPPIRADAELLRTLIANLFSNAAKYSPAGTEVITRFSREANHCRIEVIDQGPGIPDDEKETIFLRFRRGRAAGATSGAGLGLALASHIAQLHGGYITLDSNLGKGSCFTITIPFATVAEKKDAPHV